MPMMTSPVRDSSFQRRMRSRRASYPSRVLCSENVFVKRPSGMTATATCVYLPMSMPIVTAGLLTIIRFPALLIMVTSSFGLNGYLAISISLSG